MTSKKYNLSVNVKVGNSSIAVLSLIQSRPNPQPLRFKVREVRLKAPLFLGATVYTQVSRPAPLLHRLAALMHRLAALMHRLAALMHRPVTLMHRPASLLHRPTKINPPYVT
ncbi:MAG: hypothetical protein RM049_01320 [Nostoc sp. DedQUE04]|uniref:hypothetical protein n=1 Tax=Nostoc sp. DedQUE04 TaxID=3075390 RepID=UPI002AD2E079|nr:hypothetical protein [Nostoc sp. DedQUE04]MDZ8133924.1 hypothetical protein [Nostoc sp. DedQUE04]